MTILSTARARRAGLATLGGALVAGVLAVIPLTAQAATPPTTLSWSVSGVFAQRLTGKTASGGASLASNVVTWGAGTGTRAADGATSIRYVGSVTAGRGQVIGSESYKITIADPELTVAADGTGSLTAEVSTIRYDDAVQKEAIAARRVTVVTFTSTSANWTSAAGLDTLKVTPRSTFDAGFLGQVVSRFRRDFQNEGDPLNAYYGLAPAALTATAPTPATEPTTEPTVEPTVEPTTEPTVDPTTEPTTDPTTEPTVEPTTDPTTEPTSEPTTDPTTEPTTEPTVEPTTDPTTEPTTEPTVDPTTEPTVDPTTEPTVKPTTQPTVKPTTKPTAAKTPKAVVGKVRLKVRKKPTTTKRGTAIVRVTAAKGKAAPTGTVKIRFKQGKTIKVKTVVVRKGVARLKLPRLAKGTWIVKVRYSGDVQYKPRAYTFVRKLSVRS